MNRTIRILGALAMLATVATSAHAYSDEFKCDKSKSAAIGKIFKRALECYAKTVADNAYDPANCLSTAYGRCIYSFDKADTLYPADCHHVGNGAAKCEEARSTAQSFHDDL